MCNAHNHPIDCDCGWGGGSNSSFSVNGVFQKLQLQALRINTYIFESYTNPNAICPVCGEPVFFYQNSYGSRVFFDELGPPWPKHPCTDNGNLPQKNTSVKFILPKWKKEGWRPFLFKNQSTIGQNTQISGTILEVNKEIEIKRWHIPEKLVLHDNDMYFVRWKNKEWFELCWYDILWSKSRYLSCFKRYQPNSRK